MSVVAPRSSAAATAASPGGARRLRPRTIALAWGAAAFLLTAALSPVPGVSRAEASFLAEAGAGPAPASPRLRPPLPALLSRASEAVAVRLGASHLTGFRLAAALFTGLLAALLALLAGDLAGPAAAALAPALLLSAPRLLDPLLRAGPWAPGAALALATVLLYRRAVRARRRSSRLASAIAAGAAFGLALSAQLQAAALLPAFAIHALVLAFRPWPRPPAPDAEAAPEEGAERDARADADPAGQFEPAEPAEPADPAVPHRRSALAALVAMLGLGPAIGLALWPALWADPLHRLREAILAIPGDSPSVPLGALTGAHPWGYPLAITALALPVALAVALAGGIVHAASRLGAPRTPAAERQDELLLLLAAVAPLAAAQAGFAARVPGPVPWLAAFPILAALAARALLAAARNVWPSRARPVFAVLAAAALLPGLAAAVHAWPELGASWGELAGGAPGAASRGLPRHDGALPPQLLAELSARARPGARVRWAQVPASALAVYAADGRIRPDLVAADALDDADLAVIPVAGGTRQDEFAIWAALGTRTPVAGVFLDEVPLGWVYARPGAWR